MMHRRSHGPGLDIDSSGSPALTVPMTLFYMTGGQPSIFEAIAPPTSATVDQRLSRLAAAAVELRVVA